MPLDVQGGVLWEPELTPHNNCLAIIVPPITQNDSKRGEVEKNGKKRSSKSEDGKSAIFGDGEGMNTSA